MLIINRTENNKTSKHFYSINTSFLLRIKCLECFLVMSEYLNKLADSYWEWLADGFIGGVILSEFGGWAI